MPQRKPRTDCQICNLPEDIQDQIYDLYVRRNLKAIDAWKEICREAKKRGLPEPTRSSFYNHLKKHMNPERSALSHIARTEDRFAKAKGMKNVALSYLLTKFDRERDLREQLEKAIEQVMGRINENSADDRDFAQLGRTLGYLIKTRSDDRGLTAMVQEKILEDLVGTVIYQMGLAIVNSVRECKGQMSLRLKGRQREEIEPLLDQMFQQIMTGADAVYHSSIQDIQDMSQKLEKVSGG